MSCLVLNGRNESCYDSVGGIDAIYFVNRGTYVYPTDVTTEVGTDTITGITGITEIFKYELRGVNSFDQTQTPSSDNGTNFVSQALTVQLKQLTPTMHKNFKLIAYGRPSVIVKNRMDQFFFMGIEYGATMTAGSIVTGAQMGDMSGYNITLTANERIPANFLNCTTEAGLVALLDDATVVTD
jgi:hypothetical protein